MGQCPSRRMKQTHMHLVPTVPRITRFALWNIKYVFNYVTLRCRNMSARNILLTAIIWILALFPDIDFVPSGLAQDLLHSASNQVSTFAYDVIYTKQMVTDEDFTFLKLFMCLLPLFTRISGGKVLLETNRIIYKLLKIISSPTNPLLNPKEHSCVIKIISYKVLNALVPQLEDEFIENSGPPILLQNLRSRSRSDSGIILLSKCLDTVRQILQSDPRGVVRNSVLFNAGDVIVLDLCRDFLDFEVFNEKIQICIQEIFHILSILYKNSDEGSSNIIAVQLAVELLKRVYKPNENEPIYDSRIVIAIVYFIWEVVVKNEALSDTFAKLNGVYLLLDILQKCSTAGRILVLGTLVDLCDYGEGHCIPYLITWRGKHGITLIPLLMEIFRKENKELGVKTGPHGEIVETRYPLMGREQHHATMILRNVESNPAIADMYASCRPKIYALLNLVFERHASVYDIANEAYKTCNEKLKTKDQLTLLLAENFLGLKLGEVWEELQIEFESMKFEPLPTDSHIINSVVERTHKWGAHLQKLQKDLLQAELADNLLEEQKTYQILNDARITQTLESINDAKYLARCTERLCRIAQMYKQNAQVEKSMEKIKHGPAVHKTFMSKARVTPVYQQSVSIDEKCNQEKQSNELASLIQSINSYPAYDYESPEAENIEE